MQLNGADPRANGGGLLALLGRCFKLAHDAWQHCWLAISHNSPIRALFFLDVKAHEKAAGLLAKPGRL
jgi:hypothetical protein